MAAAPVRASIPTHSAPRAAERSKKLVDFLAALDNHPKVLELRADAEAFSRKYFMPGREVWGC